MQDRDLSVALERLAGPPDRAITERAVRNRAMRHHGRRRMLRAAGLSAAVVAVFAASLQIRTAPDVIVDAGASSDTATNPSGQGDTAAGNGSAAPSPSAELWDAARSDDIERIGHLLDGDAPIDEPGLFGITPLMVSAIRDNTEAADALIEGGANLELHNNAGHTALHLAARNDRPAIAVLLLERGAEPDRATKNRYGSTALMIAVGSGHEDMIDALIAGGADAGATDSAGRSVLHYVVDNLFVSPSEESTLALIEQLLNHGAVVSDPQGGRASLDDRTLDEVLEYLIATDTPRQS